MFFTPHKLTVSWPGICIAVAGVLYCGLNSTAAPIVTRCLDAGCLLFRDFSFHGISFWWAGAAYFTLMALLCARRAHALALALASLALCADAALLAVMLCTAVCISCLGAAALMGLLFLVLRRHRNGKAQHAGASAVFPLWSGLFLAALALAGMEQIRPWHIAGTEQMERRVYFSPSCGPCRDAVTAFAGKAAFVPVAERESDYAAIMAMRHALENGETMAEALEAAGKPPAFALPHWENALFRFRLLRNKAEVLRLGFAKLPLIMVNGMPQTPRPAETANPSPDLPPELAPVDSCGGQNAEPCDPPR